MSTPPMHIEVLKFFCETCLINQYQHHFQTKVTKHITKHHPTEI